MNGRLEAIPYQAAPSPPMTPELYRGCKNAVHVITTDGRILKAGQATLFVLGELGWPVRILERPPLIWMVEAGYSLVSRFRSSL